MGCKTVSEKQCQALPRMVCKEAERSQCVPTLKRECNTVYTEKCHSVPRMQCQEVQKPVETSVPEEVCVDREVTRYEEQESCTNQPIEVCVPVPKEECTTVAGPDVVIPHQVCEDKSEEECHQEPREECSQEPEEVCEPHKVKVLRRTCRNVPDRTCTEVVKEVCHWAEIYMCSPMQ